MRRFLKIKIFLSIAFLGFTLNNVLYAQSSMGGWTFHVSTSEVQKVEQVGNLLFAAYKNGILEYDLVSKEKSIVNTVNGLSDIEVSCLGSIGNKLVVGYESGNIDFYDGGTISNIPAIRLAQMQGSKKINQIVSYKNDVYFATGFGIVRIDPVKLEVRETYYPNTSSDNMKSIAIVNDSIFVTNGKVVFTANANNPILSDPAQWKIDTRFGQSSSEEYESLMGIKNDILLLKKNPNFGLDSVFRVAGTGLELVSVLPFSIEINSISAHGNRLALNLSDGIIAMKEDFSGADYILNELSPGKVFNALHSKSIDGKVYVGTTENGLIESNITGGSTLISFPGPARNSYFKLAVDKEMLIVSGGGLNGIFSTFNASGNYLLQDGEWSLLDRNTVSEWGDKFIYDFLAAAVDPNSGEFAVATYSREPVSIFSSDKKIKKIFNPTNSTLEYTVLGNGNSYVSDLAYDPLGNLWGLNGYAAEGLLKCYSKDGKWYNFSLGQNTTGFRTEELVIDYNGHVWSSVLGKGLVGYNYGGTLDNPSDDKIVNLTVGETTGALPSNTVTALAVDFDNEIWIGTENGFAILYNSESAFDAGTGEYNAQRIKLEFEGNVEFLLGSTFISAIVVDGGNRKWIGTGGAGIFCLSPDGLQILNNFTTENSPLISDFIIDMKIDHKTGEMYIITDKGLISTRIDATYEDPDYSDVRVFPNPVNPDFSGVITIQGIKFDSDVKITDAGGNLVYKTTSNGGTATWNGRTLLGDKVATGIYYIWTASNEQKGRKVGKVAIINQR
ncbi:MAG: hypothetical protein KJ941_12625 [Bacteroidetes bacterium]|nr:hypothetical protein [Bacteroidota bacterium]